MGAASHAADFRHARMIKSKNRWNDHPGKCVTEKGDAIVSWRVA
jgi:hypothetical protein